MQGRGWGLTSQICVAMQSDSQEEMSQESHSAVAANTPKQQLLVSYA